MLIDISGRLSQEEKAEDKPAMKKCSVEDRICKSNAQSDRIFYKKNHPRINRQRLFKHPFSPYNDRYGFEKGDVVICGIKHNMAQLPHYA